ncbi:unnamed protein product [Ectocarpus sp. CCAP 1310/34]|nr:unnamed protein product [Ectocarpus sp. CCAP 1310/34]
MLEELLQKTAKQQGVQLTGGPLLPCLGCSMSKGQVKPISKSTDTRAAKNLFRLFLDLRGRMQFKSIGGNWYTLIIRDDCTRWTRVFFMKHKSDAAAAFERYLADYRAETVPCEVFVARTDGGGEFQGQFAEVCRRYGIKQEFTPPNTPNNAAGDDDGGGASGGEPGASGDGGGGGSEPGEDSEQLEEYKYDPADSRYPPGREGRRLLWGASKEGPLRHGLERGRTRRETRELQGPEEPPGPDAEPDAEQALLAEIIVDYVSNSLVRERYDEEQVNIEYRREMHELPYGTELQEEAFGAEAGDDGSSQPLHDPQLSIPSPFGQKPSDVECVPLTYKDVLNSKYKVLWEAAIAKEFDGHKKPGTFSEISGLLEGQKAISAKWIFSHKTNEKGLIVDFKARMVARGVFLRFPVWIFTTHHPRPVHCDINKAYTHAKLKEEIYLRLPDGCGVWTGKAVKVERALYGLKQNGREWGFEAADALISNGYEQCRVDPCHFRKVVDGEVVGLIVIYVDDIMLSATEEERDCTWYDGCAIEVDLENGTTKLSQTAYIESMLNRFNVTTTAPTPAVVDDDLGPKRDDESSVDKPVREAIGCLMWLLFTRPDIALPLNKLQKIAHSPTERMWNALVRIMSYLNETKDLGITYVRGSGLDLDVFVDSSYADSTVDRRSTTGLAVTVGGTVVCASTKTQPVTAQSTTEAEYIAAGEGVKEALFVRGVLSFIAPETSDATIRVREDNEGALALVQNPTSMVDLLAARGGT